MSQLDSSVRTEYLNDVKIDYFDEDAIVVFTSRGNKTDHIDDYINAIKNYYCSQPPTKNLYLCFNIAGSGYGLYGLKRFRELHAILGTGLTGRIAVVVRRDIIGSSMRLFADSQLQNPIHERKFFHSQDDAVQWLRQGLQRSG